jgi:carbon storage regulator
MAAGSTRHRVCCACQNRAGKKGLEVRMLVITRREGEEVVIGDPGNPIGTVRIASIKGDRVRIAFDFPRSIDVHRREVANQINEERPSVAGTIKPSVAQQSG